MNHKSKQLPLVSVLIFVYNSEEYIRESIDSILSQTYKNIELLICDDGSTDNTYNEIRNVVSDYAGPIPIQVIKNISNKGRSYTRNRLIKIASGEYIAWQAGDDISERNRIKIIMRKMLKNSDYVAVGGGLVMFDTCTNRIIGKRVYSADPSFLKRNIFRFSPFSDGTAVIKKSAVIESGLYNEQFTVAQDLDMAFKLGLIGQFSNVSDVVLRYRVHKRAASYSKYKLQVLNTVYIRLWYSYEHHSVYKMSIFDKLANFSTLLAISLSPRFSLVVFGKIRTIIGKLLMRA